MSDCTNCYLADVSWRGSEGNWSDWHEGANKLFFPFSTIQGIFLTWLYLQFDFWEQSFRA